MYDEPDSVVSEVVTRDNLGSSDFLGIVFDTYLDRINAFGFYVNSTGAQFDAKYSQSGREDISWDAVWDSQVKIDSLGWTAEIKIPYSAIRFGSNDVQQWGLNMTRRRQKINQQTSWNFIDPKVAGFINQAGNLDGIKGIKAPVRLSLSPFLSSSLNNYPHNKPGVKNTTSTYNGGMDIKYGINQSYTLDMTLVPDFGQVRSDNQVLNLSPFEVRFLENRQFLPKEPSYSIKAIFFILGASVLTRHIQQILVRRFLLARSLKKISLKASCSTLQKFQAVHKMEWA